MSPNPTASNVAPNQDSASTVFTGWTHLQRYYCYTSPLTLSVHIYCKFNQKFQISIHHRLVDADFLFSSCVISYAPAFPPCFTSWRWFLDSHISIEPISKEASVNCRWINWKARCIPQMSCVRCLLDFYCFVRTRLSDTVHLL